MLFKTINNSNKTFGSSYKGEIQYNFWHLVNKLGSPVIGSGDNKITACWNLLFNDGTVATIYNYKDGVNYNKSNGVALDNITNWHVGGHSDKALTLVKELLFN